MTTLRAPDRKEEARKEDDRLLALIQHSVADIEVGAREVGAFEDKLHKQVEWLEAHEGHPKHAERLALALESHDTHEELLSALYRAGTTLHRRIDHLSAEGRRRAEAEHPRCTQGIDFARKLHRDYSYWNGYYYWYLEERRAK